MAQRKKKPSARQHQKLANAQYKNEFFRRMKYVINGICGEDLFFLIPKDLLEFIYIFRTHNLRVVAACGYKIPNDILKETKQAISIWAKEERIVIASNGFEISLNEYYTIALTVMNLYNALSVDKWPSVARLKAGLADFIANAESLFKQANLMTSRILQLYGVCFSEIGKTLYWFKHEMAENPELGKGIHNLINLFSHELESIVITIDGHPRPVKRMGWPLVYKGILWVDLEPSIFNLTTATPDTPIKVYIQSHALLRLAERLDCIPVCLLHQYLYLSLETPKVFSDGEGNTLIEYRFYDTKAGYLRVDLVNGVAVIRTFLFVTNNGTPEGQLLERSTGLQLLDKKYLAIDKLSTFMSTDIGDNQEVRRIFINAGCKCLLDLYAKADGLAFKHNDQQISALLLNYLGRKESLTPIPVYE